MTGSEPENVEQDAQLDTKRSATHAAGSQYALGYWQVESIDCELTYRPLLNHVHAGYHIDSLLRLSF